MGCQARGSLRKKEATFSPSRVREASNKIKILSFTPRSVYLFIFTADVDILESPALVDYSEIRMYLASQKHHTPPSLVVNCLRSKIYVLAASLQCSRVQSKLGDFILQEWHSVPMNSIY